MVASRLDNSYVVNGKCLIDGWWWQMVVYEFFGDAAVCPMFFVACFLGSDKQWSDTSKGALQLVDVAGSSIKQYKTIVFITSWLSPSRQTKNTDGFTQTSQTSLMNPSLISSTDDRWMGCKPLCKQIAIGVKTQRQSFFEMAEDVEKAVHNPTKFSGHEAYSLFRSTFLNI